MNSFNPIKGLLDKFDISLPPLPTAPPTHEPDRIALMQLAAIIGLAVSTHFSIANPVVAIFALVVFILKTGLIWQRKNAPPRFVMMLLTIISLGVIVFFYGGWNGQTAGISFLVLLVSLKFLESRTLRDYYVVCIFLYFLAASTFLFDSSILSISIVVLYTIAITGILFKISNPTPIKTVEALKASSSIIAKSVPLALLLFFFFPRISGDFGFLPSQDESRSNSLNDSLVAGDLASNAFNTELAFRVEFKGEVPDRAQLYWRSKTMLIERTFAWEVLPPTVADFNGAKTKKKASDINVGQAAYQILHEPSDDRFLPYLDYVSGYSKGEILDDYSVYAKRPSNRAIKYSGNSTFSPSLPKTTQFGSKRLISTESKPNARLQSLLSDFRRKASSNEDLVKLVYQYFVDNQFSYSLEPPILNEFTPLDDFIFNTKTGYCEHFASAFTTLMRWLGVPARIVVGYQGGTLNNTGNYLEVRYSDAHAWTEVWINNQWQRVDPTATVSPERIEFGMDALLELWDGDYLNRSRSSNALSNYLNPTGVRRYMRKLNDTWHNVGYQWNKWVVDYDKDTQQELLENIGLGGGNSAYTLIGLMMASAGGLMLFYFWQLIPKAVRRGELQRIYLQFTSKFKKHNIVKELADTPTDFAEKALTQFPQQSQEIGDITQRYQQLRYGRAAAGSNANSEEKQKLAIRLFKQQVKQFKLNKKNQTDS